MGEFTTEGKPLKPDTRPEICDTFPAVRDILIEGHARRSAAENLRQACRLNRLASEMAAASIRARYGPELSERELNLRLASLRLDRETMTRLFAWDPDVEGL